MIDIKIEGNAVIENICAKHMPCPLMSTIVDDCIEKARITKEVEQDTTLDIYKVLV